MVHTHYIFHLNYNIKETTLIDALNGAKIQIEMLILEKIKYDQLYLITHNYLFGKRVLIAWECNIFSAYINLHIH